MEIYFLKIQFYCYLLKKLSTNGIFNKNINYFYCSVYYHKLVSKLIIIGRIIIIACIKL